jgi:hypothetical protein
MLHLVYQTKLLEDRTNFFYRFVTDATAPTQIHNDLVALAALWWIRILEGKNTSFMKA